MSSALGPIAAQAVKVRRSLQNVCQEVEKRRGDAAGAEGEARSLEGIEVDIGYLRDCLSRFNLWLASVGVFQKGTSSLDTRLTSQDLSAEILRLLRQLDDFIDERELELSFYRQAVDLPRVVCANSLQRPVGPIACGLLPDIGWDLDVLRISEADFRDDDSEDDASIPIFTPESSDSAEGAAGQMTASRDLSIQIHRASKRAKFARSSTERHYDIGPDMGHIRELYPRVQDDDSLVEKLAKSNAQRRQ